MPDNDRDADLEFDDDPPPRRLRPIVPEPSSLRPLVYLLVGAFVLGLVVVGVWLGGELVTRLRNGRPPANDPQAQMRVAAPTPSLDAEESEAVNVFKVAKDGVVNVDLVVLQRNRLDGQMLERQTGGGSGFVWDTDGRIVTNYHVIEDAVKRKGIALRVVMADRSAYDARVVGKAPEYDLAVLQINAPKDKLKPITLGTSKDLEVGRKVYAIGNPFGLSLTMTTGIISNLDRSIESPTGAPITGAIQHSAQINPGNSGGPLLDRVGRLIGVNTSITTPSGGSGGNVGIGFAIPADTVNQVVTQIVRTGRPAQPDLGVRLYDQAKLRRAGYDKGVMIAEVIPGGPADKAKLRGLHRNSQTGQVEPGDVILAINGEEVVGEAEFQRIVAKLKPGDKVKVRYLRDEEEREATLTVQEA